MFHQTSTCTFTVSEVQPKFTYRVSFSNSFCASFVPGETVAVPQQSHQQLCQCTDSAGILMNSVSWLIFSWVFGSVSLHDLLDDPGRLHFDSVNGVFVHGVPQFSVDLWFLEKAQLPCKFPSVSTPGFAESTFVARPCFCRVVVVSWSLSGHPRPSLFGHPG